MDVEEQSEQTEEQSEQTVSVTRVVQRSLESVWECLMKPHGSEELLGAGGELGNKGEPWQADDGTHGVTRSFHPKEQIRFSWHADQEAPMTMVELDLAAVDENSTELSITQSKVPGTADTQALTQRWNRVLARIAEHTH